MLLGFKDNRFILHCSYEERYQAKDLGFTWDDQRRQWYMMDVYQAYCAPVSRHDSVVPLFNRIRHNIQLSMAKKPMHDSHDPRLYPFQAAGVEAITRQFRMGRKAVLLAEQQGLGKSFESIAVANEMGFENLLVVCPASLRLNWVNELSKWHMINSDAIPILSGKDGFDLDRSVVTSYELIDNVMGYNPDFIIIDECHRIKSLTARRTQKILGNNRKNIKGLVDKAAPVILLSGTPAPNGKPHELWPILYKLAGGVIGYLRYFSFIKKYCSWADTGQEILITGASKNTSDELSVRLRGSGFMIRRLKADVLADLPAKRFKLVVFPADARLCNIIEKEQEFSAEEIIKHGVPLGSALPELRREMGIAKVPQSVDYIKLLLEGGDEKVVVFAHHRQVVEELTQHLSNFNPGIIYGGISSVQKQKTVERFQTDLSMRVIIGNEAMEEGLTLTASNILVSVEPEWVPAKEMQRADRLHRIGQTKTVEIHILVVERSIDARILGSATYKAQDFNLIFNKEVAM